MSPGAKGYIPRDFPAQPFGSVVEPYEKRHSRDTWKDLLELQDQNRTSALDVMLSSNFKSYDQKSLPYCWSFGVCAPVAVAMARAGHDPIPHLSASYVAGKVKNWRRVGGWGMQAVEGLLKYGCPTTDVFPEASTNRTLADTDKVKASAALHSIVQFEEIQSNDFDGCISALLDPINPACGVSMAFNYWRHLVFACKACWHPQKGWGVVIQNSWGSSWGDQGRKELYGSKAIAHEMIVVRSAKVRKDGK